MTPPSFSSLPETVSRKVFCALTGIPPRTVNRMVARGALRVWRAGNDGYPRHLKVEIARIMGWEYHPVSLSPRTPPAPAAASQSPAHER